MKAFYFQLTILLLLAASLKSQTTHTPINDNINDALVLVGKFRTDMKHFIINSKQVQSVQVLKDKTAVALYGESGKKGVIIFTPKKSANLLKLKDILNKYKIADKDRHLRISLNEEFLPAPEKILIEDSEIKGVEIITDEKLKNTKKVNSHERFINIEAKVN
jgi:hypothetical protein